jgi:cyclase
MCAKAKRVIARLDVKGERLIKGIHLEGWRFLPGEPLDYCLKYYEAGIDEILYIDAVASLYSRDFIKGLIERYTKDVFVPITVGGGIRSVADAYEILRSGADKIAINSQSVKDPDIINELAKNFGSQCVVASVQAKRHFTNNTWEVWYDTARERTERKVEDWVRELEDRGAGEILITSVDRDGTMKGIDEDLSAMVCKEVSIPVIVSGGFGSEADFLKAAKAGADAVAIARALHYGKVDIKAIKDFAVHNNLNVRI